MSLDFTTVTLSNLSSWTKVSPHPEFHVSQKRSHPNPPFVYSIANLDPTNSYTVALRVSPIGNGVFKYNGKLNRCVLHSQGEASEAQSSQLLQLPGTLCGANLMSYGLDFSELFFTVNEKLRDEKTFILKSQQLYQASVIISEEDGTTREFCDEIQEFLPVTNLGTRYKKKGPQKRGMDNKEESEKKSKKQKLDRAALEISQDKENQVRYYNQEQVPPGLQEYCRPKPQVANHPYPTPSTTPEAQQHYSGTSESVYSPVPYQSGYPISSSAQTYSVFRNASDIHYPTPSVTPEAQQQYPEAFPHMSSELVRPPVTYQPVYPIAPSAPIYSVPWSKYLYEDIQSAACPPITRAYPNGIDTTSTASNSSGFYVVPEAQPTPSDSIQIRPLTSSVPWSSNSYENGSTAQLPPVSTLVPFRR